MLPLLMSVGLVMAASDDRPPLVVASLQTNGVRKAHAVAVAELVRNAVAKSGNYVLVTPEETRAINSELQRQLSGGCTESTCITELGGALGAQYLITGSLNQAGRRLLLTLKLIDIERLVAANTTTVHAPGIEQLMDRVPITVHALITAKSKQKRLSKKSARKAQPARQKSSSRHKTAEESASRHKTAPEGSRARKLPKGWTRGSAPQRRQSNGRAPKATASGPVVTGNEITEVFSVLSVVSIPEGVEFKIRGPSLSDTLIMEQQVEVSRKVKPGTYRWSAKLKGHESAKGEITVEADRSGRIAFRLPAYGHLRVEGQPVGSKVEISGPNGFRTVSGLPVTVSGTPKGSYSVKVSRDGYASFTTQVAVHPERTQKVKVRLRAEPIAEQERQRRREWEKRLQRWGKESARTSMFYADFDASLGTGASTIKTALWLAPYGIPGLGSYLPNLQVGMDWTSTFKTGDRVLNEPNLLLSYEFMVRQKRQLIPPVFQLTARIGPDWGGEMGWRIYTPPPKSKWVGSPMRFNAFLGAAALRGVYLGLGIGFSWHAPLAWMFYDPREGR